MKKNALFLLFIFAYSVQSFAREFITTMDDKKIELLPTDRIVESWMVNTLPAYQGQPVEKWENRLVYNNNILISQHGIVKAWQDNKGWWYEVCSSTKLPFEKCKCWTRYGGGMYVTLSYAVEITIRTNLGGKWSPRIIFY